MAWFRMARALCRVAWPDVFTPWRSPLLRWRMETYGVTDARGRLLHADELTPSRMLRFALGQRRELLRFLRWAARL